jgi:hypothetical protein
MLACHRKRFFARQKRRHGAGRLCLNARFHTALIEIGRIRLDRHAGSRQKHSPGFTLRRQNQRRIGKP